MDLNYRAEVVNNNLVIFNIDEITDSATKSSLLDLEDIVKNKYDDIMDKIINNTEQYFKAKSSGDNLYPGFLKDCHIYIELKIEKILNENADICIKDVVLEAINNMSDESLLQSINDKNILHIDLTNEAEALDFNFNEVKDDLDKYILLPKIKITSDFIFKKEIYNKLIIELFEETELQLKIELF